MTTYFVSGLEKDVPSSESKSSDTSQEEYAEDTKNNPFYSQLLKDPNNAEYNFSYAMDLMTVKSFPSYSDSINGMKPYINKELADKHFRIAISLSDSKNIKYFLTKHKINGIVFIQSNHCSTTKTLKL